MILQNAKNRQKKVAKMAKNPTKIPDLKNPVA